MQIVCNRNRRSVLSEVRGLENKKPQELVNFS